MHPELDKMIQSYLTPVTLIGKNLAKALLTVQTEVEAVSKTADNPYFNSKYADLNTVIDAIKPLLNKAGVVFIQAPVQPKFEGTLALATTLIHVDSGEQYTAIAEVPLSKSDPQAYGSAVTYTRRYSLVAIFGLQQEDDDGNAASSPTVKKPQQAPKPNTASAKPAGGGFLQRKAPAVGVQKNNAKPKTGLFPQVETQEAADE